MFVHIDQRTLILKVVEGDVFLMKPKHQSIYSSEWNEFVVPNHKKKGDYYVNQSLSYQKMNFNPKKDRKRCLSYETKASIPFIL